MKKLLSVTLVLLALVAFAGSSVGHIRKAGQARTIPPANKVTLSGISNNVSKKCSVTAKPGLTGNPAAIYTNHPVHFEKLVGNNWIALSPNSVTNSQGVTPSRPGPWNAKIRAWITKSSGQKAYSDEFPCGNPAVPL